VNLIAVSIGYAVPGRDFDATVHSVFKDVANLSFGKKWQLLTLMTALNPDLPQGIRIDTTPGFSFQDRLQLGEKLICKNGILWDEHGHLSIRLKGASRWKCCLPYINMHTSPAVGAWSAISTALEMRQKHTSAQICITELFHLSDGQSGTARKLGLLTRELVRTTRKLELPGKETLAGLIGLGLGLTPSGDDLLVGFLAGLRCAAGGDEERRSFLSHLGRIVMRLSRWTTDISRTYLYHATHGQFSRPLELLTESIANSVESHYLLSAAKAVMDIGHSSGMETLTGLLIGLSVWEKGMLPA